MAPRLLVTLLLAATVAAAAAAGIEQVEHVVIWMQENRAFDHYYGTLKGVRGFNDRASPPLPDGKNVFFQPGKVPSASSELCGCVGCDIQWTPAGNVFKGAVLGMSCGALAGDLSSATPPVKVTEGMSCSSLLKDLYGTSFDGFHLNEMFKNTSTCPASLKVTGLGTADPASESYILPFNLQFTDTAAQCMPAPEMDYFGDTGIFNGGLMDGWNTARAPGFGMAYFNRTDLPYYYALADAFTVGDQYYQSTFTATNPNRLHLFSGSNGLSAGSAYDALDDSEPAAGFDWETVAETLQDAGISWKVLQEADNFDDNALAWFANFKNAEPGSPLYDNGMARVEDIVASFTEMVQTDTLPQVLWIVGPMPLSEHATNHPASGEDLSHRLIDVLADPANQKVYAKTVFILNYDEGGQFFDHHLTPTPPTGPDNGKSTVSTEGELTKEQRFGVPAGSPIGLGFRVPIFFISPWTRGPYTFSEISDHTSVIKFIEQRFGVHCPNISPWRRAVTGDLMAAFDWDTMDLSWPSSFPSTANNVNSSEWQCEHLPPPTLPKVQTFPVQEAGTRMARPIPYEFLISDSVANGEVTVVMNNTGTGAGVFYVFNNLQPSVVPKKYTVEGGKVLSDEWPVSMAGKYNISLYGPNGFVRKMAGAPSYSATASMRFNKVDSVVVIDIQSASACLFHVTDNAYGASPATVTTAAGVATPHVVPVAASGNWYDLTVTADESCEGGHFSRSFMGHLENGQPSITDPAMGDVDQTMKHPHFPEEYKRSIYPWAAQAGCKDEGDTRRKDECWGLGASTGAMDPHPEL